MFNQGFIVIKVFTLINGMDVDLIIALINLELWSLGSYFIIVELDVTLDFIETTNSVNQLPYPLIPTRKSWHYVGLS